MKCVILPLILATLIGACGEKPSSSLSSKTPSTEKLNKQQQRRFDNAKKPLPLSWQQTESDSSENPMPDNCEDCPNSFGQLISRTVKVDTNSSSPKQKISIKNCQAALGDSGLVYTNRHCLPDDLLKPGASCFDRIRMLLPTSDERESETILECDKIIATSPRYPNLSDSHPQPDWAVLKMKTSPDLNTPPLHLEGIEDNKTLLGFVPLKDPKTKKLSVEVIRCTSVMNTLAAPEYQHKNSPILRLICDKDITKGFSGTALYKNTSEGLVPAALISHIWQRQINKEDILASKYVTASNLSCLPRESSERPNECEFDSTKNRQLRNNIVLEALKRHREKNLVKKMSRWLKKSDSPVDWQEVNLDQLGTLPPHLQKIIKKRLSMDVYGYSEQGRREYLKSIIPIYASCIKKDTVEKVLQGKKVMTTMPSVHFIYSMDSRGYARVETEVKSLKAQITPSAAKSGYFVLHRQQDHPDSLRFNRSDIILQTRFHHGTYIVPPCDD